MEVLSQLPVHESLADNAINTRDKKLWRLLCLTIPGFAAYARTPAVQARLDAALTYSREYDDGTVMYFNRYGNFRRTDGPAVAWADGTNEWWVNGERHRIDWPAIVRWDGTRGWYVNGELHRTDGPAVEWASGAKEWWINGDQVDP